MSSTARNGLTTDVLTSKLETLLVGQPDAIRTIVPYVQTFQAGLSPLGRPAGVFLLLGPTGTGKTRTVEALAQALHGNKDNVLKIDCGEYQLDHEIAKLIGAPPGYLGHRETLAALAQNYVNQVASENCHLSIVLFDEIEKAAAPVQDLLLGILDKGKVRLGDNTSVTFENCLIFFTSNLGTRQMTPRNTPGFVLEISSREQNAAAALQAVKRRFSPEFVNRIDEIMTYVRLTRTSCVRIIDILFDEMNSSTNRRRLAGQNGGYTFSCSRAAGELLLDQGISEEYGARELKRLVQRVLVHPSAAIAMSKDLPDATVFRLEAHGGRFSVTALKPVMVAAATVAAV